MEDEQWLLRTGTIQFYMGGATSGAQPHWHGSSWNWLVHGSKRWFLWPPDEALYSQSHVERTVGDQSLGGATAAAAVAAPRGKKQKAGRRGGMLSRALRCDQRPGEVIVLPELWGHATYNLERSIGWASEFYFDRSMDDGLSHTHGDEWWRVGERPPEMAHAASDPQKRRGKRNLIESRPMGVYGGANTESL